MEKYTYVNIFRLIEEKRRQMIQVGLAKGLTNHETVRLSKELDVLLNIHQRRYLLSKKWSSKFTKITSSSILSR
ncbi:aspartyl-phosphate phosphatase Spo0E family protein [Bacillus sp. 2205SS5-2]|uniref:aspartyl-phosphate phosphatase Spo0E family protein n=1 Tax=Bacillus sp. 2205SS5-2 TaxID=3109031 RepID=UPI003006C98E